MRGLFFIALGGMFGASARYIIAGITHRLYPNILFPIGTLFVNVSGSFLIGFLSYLFSSGTFLNYNLRVFLLIGFLGSYTTFSTYSLETMNFLSEKLWDKALLNIFTNNILSLFSVVCGIIIGRLIFYKG